MKGSLRETKPLLHYSILAFMYALGIATLFSHTLLHALSSHEQSEAHGHVTCSATAEHMQTVTFNKTSVSPRTVEVAQCDEIRVVNNTGKEFELALGAHSHHVSYPSFEETILKPGDVYTFRASQIGTYPIHDHDNYELSGSLTIR